MNNTMQPSAFSRHATLALLCTALLAGCGKEKPAATPATPEQRATLITTVRPTLSDVEVIEESVGSLETVAAPAVAAEVAGKVTEIAVDVGQTVSRGQPLAHIDARDFKLEQDAAQAETKRVQALIRSQQKQVDRYEVMVKENFITHSRLDEALAQLDALNEQLAGAQARLASAQRNLGKVVITSPTDGQVAQRLISVGDYVKAGAPLFHISRSTTLQAHLPFPERIAAQLAIGLPVRLSTPSHPDDTLAGRVSEIRPTVGRANKALDVIVELDNPGGWRAGGSVRGAVIVNTRQQAVMIPEICVVQRPAGAVVYRIEKGMARSQPVELGVHRDGLVEVLSGLNGTETLAQDGAAYLSDGAAVKTGGTSQP